MNVIGRKDKIDLPELELFDIKAKIDTGAYGSALHCHHIKVVEHKGKKVLAFVVLDPAHPEFENKIFYASNFDYRSVKSSIGETEDRYTIKTDVIVFGKKRKVEFSLTDRSNMKNPVLLGRKFLVKKFIVDVQLKDLSYNQKHK